MMITSAQPYYSVAAFTLLFCPAAPLYSFATHVLLFLTRRLPKPAEAVPPPIGAEKEAAKEEEEGERIAVVTGSNTGIGYETAKKLAVDHGYTVVLACRSRDRAASALRSIGEEARGAAGRSAGRAVFVHPLDLSSFASVREFAKELRNRYKRIHLLVNNAGTNSRGAAVMQDDSPLPMDLAFCSNFAGHFLLTSLLIDDMAAGSRVINLSSVMHHFCAGFNVETVEYWRGAAAARTAPKEAYPASKLAALLFTAELNRRYSDRIRAVAVNPGSVYVFCRGRRIVTKPAFVSWGGGGGGHSVL
jgi:NAD(P)-dependent dehydrogenase (short-subunit alcohol dehydrogenase family)